MIDRDKKILYCIHINWGWIKQRPHFIAECLNKFYQVDVLCTKVWGNSSRLNKTNVKLIFPFRLPFGRFKIVNVVNTYIRQSYMRKIVKRYDCLWFTAPTEDCNFILSIVDNNIKVVYDCMDDLLEFPEVSDKYEKIFANEKMLYERADLVLCSSLYLKRKLTNRYGSKRIIVVNNALSLNKNIVDNLSNLYSIKGFTENTKVKIVYIGTISEWFDMDLCKKILDIFHNVAIYLWGPCEASIIKKNTYDGLIFCGSIEHKYVESILEYSDILIMPFVINELILSVNPVKLYEYVKSGKPCLAPLYGESRQFDDYVYLYNNHNECINILESILSGAISAKRTKEECMKFAKLNTWEKRADMIREELDKLID